MTGTLWVVATPIGNLEDLSSRALRILGEAPVIAAEDTRVSRKLVPARETPPDWVRLDEHGESRAIAGLLARLGAGDDVALVSDAGTPLISDPGYRLVSAALKAGIRVSPVPGPCAAIAALSVAGLATDRFWFEGFLPAKSDARRRRLERLSKLTATVVFYVPARDLQAVLADLAQVLGPQRQAVVGRELTKQFETIRKSELAALAEWVAGDTSQARGEAVVLVEGCDREAGLGIDPARLARELADELPPARAARIISRLTDLDRKAAFALVESLRHPETTDGSKH